jgi:AraC-like DNA-binding protein
MKIASRWLASSDPGSISIAEIAFRVGFKSPAHFSRMFKRVFKQGPREYRANCPVTTTGTCHDILTGGGTNTLQ